MEPKQQTVTATTAGGITRVRALAPIVTAILVW